MATFEEIIKTIVNDSNWLKKILIGIILAPIPLINFIALGYLYKYANHVRQTRQVQMPNWPYWADLIQPGVFLFLIGLLYYGILIMIGSWLSVHVGSLFYILVLISILIGPAFISSALFEFQKSGEQWKSLLNYETIIGRVLISWPRLIIPSLSFAALHLLSWISPILMAMSFFAGAIFYLAFTTHVFTESRHY